MILCKHCIEAIQSRGEKIYVGEEIEQFIDYNEEKEAFYFCGSKNYHSINNCKKCNSRTTCNLCKDGYTFIDDDKSLCQNR